VRVCTDSLSTPVLLPASWQPGEGGPVGAWCESGHSGQVQAQGVDGADAAALGNLPERKIGRFEQLSCTFNALLQQPLQRADSGLGAKSAGEGPDAGMGVPGEVGQAQRFGRPPYCPGARAGEGRSVFRRQRGIDELGLPAWPDGATTASRATVLAIAAPWSERTR
jgi:hypothetical protein